MYDEAGNMVPPERHIPHYYGDFTRGLFIIAALFIVLAKSTGAELPLSTTGAIASAILLVLAAGITNPAQRWIHWVNALLASAGSLVFGIAAVEHYRAGLGLLDPSFAYLELLAVMSLLALYNTTRTIRGMLLHERR